MHTGILRSFQALLIGSLLTIPGQVSGQALCNPELAPQTPEARTLFASISHLFPDGACAEELDNQPVYKDFHYIGLRVRWIGPDSGKPASQEIREITDGVVVLPQAIDMRTRTDIVARAKVRHAPPLDVPLAPTELMGGNPDAPHRITMFSDYDCGYCQQAFEWLLERSGEQIAFYKKDMVLFPNSRLQAMAAKALVETGIMNRLEAARHLYKLPLAEYEPDEARQKLFASLPQEQATQLQQYLQEHAEELGASVDHSTSFAREQQWRGTPVILIDGKQVPGGFNRSEISERIAAFGNQ